MNRLNGLNQCLSELQTTEADLMQALGALPETFHTCDPVDLSLDLDRFLFLLTNTVEAREIHTLGHIERVTHLGVSLGQRLGLVEKDKKALEMGCVLHDIGKIGLPAGLLNQNHSLNAGDLARMHHHPEIGYHLCRPLQRFLGGALDIIRQHHERLDGSGYPHGLKGEKIGHGARIMTVIDIYDALTTDRPYRKAMTRETAIAILRREVREGKIDGGIVESLALFLERDPQTLMGDRVSGPLILDW